MTSRPDSTLASGQSKPAAPDQRSPASLFRRLASMLYDTLLALAVLFLAWLLPHILLGLVGKVMAHPALLWGHFFLVLLLYFGWLWLHGGQTLAMKTWRIRLVNANGGGIQPLQALLRYLLAWPSLGFFGAGLVWALFDRDGQFLHDRLAGTRLVNSNHA